MRTTCPAVLYCPTCKERGAPRKRWKTDRIFDVHCKWCGAYVLTFEKPKPDMTGCRIVTDAVEPPRPNKRKGAYLPDPPKKKSERRWEKTKLPKNISDSGN